MEADNPAMRSAKVAVDVRGLSRPAKVVGVTSTLSRDGKTTVVQEPSGLHFLPAAAKDQFDDACHLLTSRSMQDALEQTRGEYDSVDLPSITRRKAVDRYFDHEAKRKNRRSGHMA
jgi:hypothetical protein